MIVGGADEDALPAGTEDRLGQFSELVAESATVEKLQCPCDSAFTCTHSDHPSRLRNRKHICGEGSTKTQQTARMRSQRLC